MNKQKVHPTHTLYTGCLLPTGSNFQLGGGGAAGRYHLHGVGMEGKPSATLGQASSEEEGTVPLFLELLVKQAEEGLERHLRDQKPHRGSVTHTDFHFPHHPLSWS